MEKARHALVVGGAGFVGRAAVSVLLDRGWRVSVLDPNPASLPPEAARVTASLLDPQGLDALLRQDRPDAIAWFAAFGEGRTGLARGAEANPDRAIAVNVLSFRTLLSACIDAGVRRVAWASSTVVLGAARSWARVDEDAPRAPLGTYALTKTLAEEVAAFMRRRHGMEIVGLRIPLILGPGLWYDGAASWVKRLVAAAAPGAAPEIAVPDGVFDAMHVADVGRLFADLMEGPPPTAPIYHVAGFATGAGVLAAILARLVPGYAPVLRPEPPPVRFPLVDDARLRRDTGFTLVHDAEAVLRDMLAERDRKDTG